jgi:hypothetical protein
MDMGSDADVAEKHAARVEALDFELEEDVVFKPLLDAVGVGCVLVATLLLVVMAGRNACWSSMLSNSPGNCFLQYAIASCTLPSPTNRRSA